MRMYGFTRRIVIDTNVVVAALLSPMGDTSKFMGEVFDGKYEVIVTESIISEYREVLRREKFQLDDESIEFVLAWFIESLFTSQVDSHHLIPTVNLHYPVILFI